MSITKRPDGMYRARVREYAGGPERSQHFSRKVDAERWQAEMKVALARGTYLTADELKITLGQYVETHTARQLWRAGTKEAAMYAFRRAEAHFGSDRPLTSIRRGDVESYVVGLSTMLAPGTVRLTFQHLRTLIRAAVADGIVVVDPTMKVKLPAVSAELTIPTAAHVRALIDHAPSMFGTAIILGAHVGLRAGEAQGLLVSDVDFLRKTINVRRQLDGRTMTLAEPKTRASTRTIPVPESVTLALAAHVAAHGAGRDGVLLHNGGEYMSDARFRTLWRRAQTDAALDIGTIKFHWLRHSFASSLISAGCSVKAVAVAMGHENPSITLQTYASLWPGDDDRVRSAIEAAWKIADQLRTEQTGS